MSGQIQKLEEELDIILFDRSRKPILVTDIGQAIIDQARKVLKEHHKLERIAASDLVEPRGDFSLAVIPTLAPYLIPIFLDFFAKSYPQVRLNLSISKTEDLILALEKDEIDAGLMVTPLKDERLIERHLFYEPFHIYLSKCHEMSVKESIDESDLSYEGLWLLEEGHCFRDQVLNLCGSRPEQRVLPNVAFTSGDLETLKNLIKKGRGYTVVPHLSIIDLHEQELVDHVRHFSEPVPTREVSLVHSRDFYKQPIIDALEKVIIDGLPKDIQSLKRQHIKRVNF